MTERVQTEIIRELAARLKQAVEYLENVTGPVIAPSDRLTLALHCRAAIAHAEGKPVSQHFEKFE